MHNAELAWQLKCMCFYIIGPRSANLGQNMLRGVTCGSTADKLILGVQRATGDQAVG